MHRKAVLGVFDAAGGIGAGTHDADLMSGAAQSPDQAERERLRAADRALVAGGGVERVDVQDLHDGMGPAGLCRRSMLARIRKYMMMQATTWMAE